MAMPGNRIVLYKDTSEGTNQVYIEGVNEKDQRTVFKARAEVKEKN